MLKFGAITCVVMLILGVLAAGSEFRHRTIVPVLLATPHRARVFAVRVAVIAGLGAVFSAVTFGLGLGTVVATLSAHGVHHLPPGVARLYLGTVISSASQRIGPRRTPGCPRSRFASRMPLVIAPSA
jgi:hypothetical protein